MTIQPTRGELKVPGGLTLSTAVWQPGTAPVALALISHGHAEHLGRYQSVIESLLTAGYAVAGQDHRGHGRSEGTPALAMRFDDYVDDFRLMVLQRQEQFSGLPVVLIGHSMGGLIAARYALRYQRDLSALVLSGAAFVIDEGVNPIIRSVMHLIAQVAPRAPIPRDDSDSLGADPAVSERFASDPLNYHGKTRMRTASEMARAGADALERAPSLTIPLLAMHGAEDTLTSPRGTERFYDRSGSTDKTLKFWPGMKHEIFHEVDGSSVITYMNSWLAERIPT